MGVEELAKMTTEEDLAQFQKLQALEKKAEELRAQVAREQKKEESLRMEAESLRAQAKAIDSADAASTIAQAQKLFAALEDKTAEEDFSISKYTSVLVVVGVACALAFLVYRPFPKGSSSKGAAKFLKK